MARIAQAGSAHDPVTADAARRRDMVRNRALGRMAPTVVELFTYAAYRDPLRFRRSGVLVRTSDPSGISGTGDVAFVVGCIDGAVCLAWPKCGGIEAFASVADAIECHGHNGQTYILWADGTTSGRGGAS